MVSLVFRITYLDITNILWNTSGLIIPLFIFFISTPILLSNLGTDRYGLFNLVFGFIVLSTIFDLGIGRLCTRLIATAGNKKSALISVIFSGIQSTVIYSIPISVLLLILLLNLDVEYLIKVETDLQHELSRSLLIFAASIPIQALLSTLKGINEGFENFRKLNLIRIVMGSLSVATPTMISHEYQSISILIFTIIIIRLLHVFLLYFILPNKVKVKKWSRIHSKNIKIWESTWFTLENVTAQSIPHIDKVIIGLLTANMITYYAIPFDLVSQTLFIIGAITTIIYPKLSKALKEDRKNAIALFSQWMRASLILISLVAIFLYILLPYILKFLMGQNFSEISVSAGTILIIGLIFYTISTMNIAFLHADNLAKETAIASTTITILYIPLTLILTEKYSIIGTAISWLIKNILSSIILLYVIHIKNKQ